MVSAMICLFFMVLNEKQATIDSRSRPGLREDDRLAVCIRLKLHL